MGHRRCARRLARGFTLAELLVAVAIIAVLIAVAIPLFSASSERAKAGVCMANRRSLFGQLTYARMLEGLTQEQAEQMRDDFGTICPADGTITVTVGENIAVTCSVHGESGADDPEVPANGTASQGLLKDFTAFVKDPGTAVSNNNRYSNNKLREAFYAENGNRWPILIVDGKEYQIEPYLASQGKDQSEIQENTEQYLWLFAREKQDGDKVINGQWNVPLVYNPKTGQWYESRNYLGTGQDNGSITAKDLEALQEKLQETHSNGKPKWRVVESWQES